MGEEEEEAEDRAGQAGGGWKHCDVVCSTADWDMPADRSHSHQALQRHPLPPPGDYLKH